VRSGGRCGWAWGLSATVKLLLEGDVEGLTVRIEGVGVEVQVPELPKGFHWVGRCGSCDWWIWEVSWGITGNKRALFPISYFCTTIMSEAKLKSLKVVDLKDILSKAAVSVPAKANKQDLIARILGSPAALAVYNKQQNPNATSSAAPISAAATDDLVRAFLTFSLPNHSYSGCSWHLPKSRSSSRHDVYCR